MKDQDLEKLIEEVERYMENDSFDKFIVQARFPNFKNLAPGTVVNFKFPITLIVGANGSGKSSILHALWGMPYRYSSNRFWFSTEIDPIQEGGAHGNVRYIYTYYEKAINERLTVRKIRTRQQLGYFEPTKPSIRDGMDRMPEPETRHIPYRTDRWNPVDRDVIYINSKCEVGVSERYFYQVELGRINEKLTNFAYEASRLKAVVHGDLQSSRPGGHEYVFTNKTLDHETLKYVNDILDQDYIEARYLLHRFYDRSKAPSVIFKRANRTYSDAFAGSGELSVVTTVLKILDAKMFDLVLIDEPETSLHPQAQINLIKFLLGQIKRKKIQVVISTHSPTIVESLPRSALKVLEIDLNGNAVILEDVDRSIAFHRIGHIQRDKVTVVVEDQLLHVLVNFSSEALDAGQRQRIDIQLDSVGVDEVWTHHIPSWINGAFDIYFIADGDQNDVISALPTTENIGEDDKLRLKDTLAAIGKRPAGLRTPEQFIEYIRWAQSRIKTIDAVCPERIFLELIAPQCVGNVIPPTNKNFKVALIRELAQSGYGSGISAAELNVIFRTLLAKQRADGDSNSHVIQVTSVLQEIANGR